MHRKHVRRIEYVMSQQKPRLDMIGVPNAFFGRRKMHLECPRNACRVDVGRKTPIYFCIADQDLSIVSHVAFHDALGSVFLCTHEHTSASLIILQRSYSHVFGRSLCDLVRHAVQSISCIADHTEQGLKEKVNASTSQSNASGGEGGRLEHR